MTKRPKKHLSENTVLFKEDIMNNSTWALPIFLKLYQENLEKRSKIQHIEEVLDEQMKRENLLISDRNDILDNIRLSVEEERVSIIGWFLNNAGFKIGASISSDDVDFSSEEYYFYCAALDLIKELFPEGEENRTILDVVSNFGLQAYLFIREGYHYTGLDNNNIFLPDYQGKKDDPSTLREEASHINFINLPFPLDEDSDDIGMYDVAMFFMEVYDEFELFPHDGLHDTYSYISKHCQYFLTNYMEDADILEEYFDIVKYTEYTVFDGIDADEYYQGIEESERIYLCKSKNAR